MKKKSWEGAVKVNFEPVRESEFRETLAELGELFYSLISSCQLRNQNSPSIATKKPNCPSDKQERQVANE